MAFSAFVEWAFLGFLSGVLFIFWDMKNSLSQMKESVIELNGKIVLLIEKDEQARVDIDDHEDRLRILENNIRRKSHGVS